MTRRPHTIIIACIVALGSFLTAAPAAIADEMRKDFVYLRDVDPSIEKLSHIVESFGVTTSGGVRMGQLVNQDYFGSPPQ